jgi:hypothetical protein
MISEAEVRELVGQYLGGCEVTITRSSCGWSTPCGWQVSIISDIPGNQHTIYLRDDNTVDSAWSKITTLADNALNPA